MSESASQRARTPLVAGQAGLQILYLSAPIILLIWLLSGCSRGEAKPAVSPASHADATATERTSISPIPFETISREISFQSDDRTWLAGQLDRPADQTQPPLVFIIHHSGAVDRGSYQYLAARLVPAGYAVFRFDKRGAGRSGGAYGCCEDEDALAAYRAAVTQGSFDPECVFVVAQSIGTEILARHFDEFEQTHHLAGVMLLSSLLEGEEVLAIRAPLHIIVSDSEPNLATIGKGAVKAHLAHYDYGASFYVAQHTEHTLFDISDGPMDWSDPHWPEKFHAGAWSSMRDWLEEHRKAICG